MTKFLILGLALLTTPAFAGTRCAQEVRSAVGKQAFVDFPRAVLTILVPNLNNEKEVSVETYQVLVRDVRHMNRALAKYSATIDEVCRVLGVKRN